MDEVLVHIDTALETLRTRAAWYESRPCSKPSRHRVDTEKRIYSAISFWEQVRALHLQEKP